MIVSGKGERVLGFSQMFLPQEQFPEGFAFADRATPEGSVFNFPMVNERVQFVAFVWGCLNNAPC